jgi:pachytene checkpoint protein 2
LPDSAFVDRADIIQYVDLPPRDAIYEILRSCLSELVRKDIINETVRVTHLILLQLPDKNFQEVPSLTQAVLYERTATFPITSPPNSTSPLVHPLASTGANATPVVYDLKEKSKNVALRLLKLAEKCRV